MGVENILIGLIIICLGGFQLWQSWGVSKQYHSGASQPTSGFGIMALYFSYMFGVVFVILGISVMFKLF